MDTKLEQRRAAVRAAMDAQLLLWDKHSQIEGVLDAQVDGLGDLFEACAVDGDLTDEQADAIWSEIEKLRVLDWNPEVLDTVIDGIARDIQ
jgi:hypothetical protein